MCMYQGVLGPTTQSELIENSNEVAKVQKRSDWSNTAQYTLNHHDHDGLVVHSNQWPIATNKTDAYQIYR